MLTKRRVIVGTIVFIFVGLLLFTFANPSQVNEGSGNNTNVNEQEKEEKNDKKEETTKEEQEVIKTPEENTNVVVDNGATNNGGSNNGTTNNGGSNTTNEKELAERLEKIAKLISLLDKNKDDYTTDSFVDYGNLVAEISSKKTADLTNKEIDDYIEKLEAAIEKLVELKLTGLTVSSNNDEYKRSEKQKELTFTAIYNDELRNKEVNATTEDKFDSKAVIEAALMTYTYSDKYGKASVDYKYSVVKNERDILLEQLEEVKKDINEEDYTKESVDNYNEVKDTDVEELTNEELEKLIEDIKEAYKNLVELKLTGLTVSSNNDVYKRLESQKELTFTAIYNDELRNKEVNATTEDKFNSESIIEAAKMTYSYSDKYGEASVDYNYSVVKNDRDILLEELEEVKKDINKEDYTKESVDNYNEVKDTDPENLTNEEIKQLIEEIKEAYENLVELKLTGLKVSSNNDEYKRLEKQKELTFTAIYNDETRNKEVETTTEDTFSSEAVIEAASMTYTYSDKYGKASVDYKYSVVKNDRDILLEELEEVKKDINEEDYTKESVDNYNEVKDTDPEELTDDELEQLIKDIKEAYENLVELKLTGLTISSNNDEYKRLESQKELTFTAIYNDELRNKEVNATTEDTFNSESVIEAAKMTYSYSDKYGEASVDYNYSVVKNRRDILLEELEKVKKDINEEDYTTESVNNYNNVKNTDPEPLTDDELEQLIKDIKDSYNALVELELTGLTVSSNNDEYKRSETQKELTFTAIYNDETRNKEVEATTEDKFDTTRLSDGKTMTYSYNDKYGKASVVYNYTVVKNNRDQYLDDLLNREINEEDYTSESVENLNNVKDEIPEELDADELEEAIEKLEQAYDSLVELKLTGLTVSSNNDVYARSESQKELTFTATYNDETRNKEVEAITSDEFDTTRLSDGKTMTYSYSDKYGKASVVYNYTVVKNERDQYLDELLNREINEEDYTSESVENLNNVKDEIPEELDADELEEAIEKLEQAYENLVELELTGLTVSSNNDEYKRSETQKELIFTATYNDETRNKEVEATTSDEFDTTRLSDGKTMTYTYSDKYGYASIVYNYTVVKNERDQYLDELLNRKINEEDYTSESVENLNNVKNEIPEDLNADELEEAIEKLEQAYDSLVELELTGLTVSSNNDVYARLESQKELTFTAIYNDETRNKEVEVTTEDTFNSESVIEAAKMTYTYSDKYGEASVDYNYSVVKNRRDILLEELEKVKKDINEEDYTTKSVNNYNNVKNTDPEPLTDDELEQLIKDIKDAYNALVELELTGLTVSSNNDEYKRLESQKELTFTAIYNDETRNKEVNATTEDEFNSKSVIEAASMTYTYSDKYGEASVDYNYSVVKNRRDILLEQLEEVKKDINEEDYTTESVNDYNEVKDTDPEELTDDELEQLIEDIKEAYENLVELVLTGLTVSSNNDVYARLESQKELTFTAIYNDELRNKKVEVIGNVEFDSSTNGDKSINYVYSDKYGSKDVTYNYTVVRNEDDKVIVGITAELSQNTFNYLSNVNIKDYLTVYEVAKDSVKTKTTDYTVEGFTTNELATSKKLTIKHNTFNTTLTYNVVRTEEGQQLKSIRVTLDKENYDWKSTSYTKTVIATDNDNIEYDVTNDVEILKDLDTNTLGSKEYKVSYTKNGVTKEATTNYNVVRTEEGMKLDHITVSLSNSEFTRESTESEARKRLTVTAFDTDNTSYKVEDYTTDFDASDIGNKVLTVSYTKGEITKEGKVNYTVVKNENDKKIVKVDVSLSKDNYSINEEIEGLEVEVTYGYGNKEKINTCTNNFNSSEVGYNKTLTVTCDGVKGTTNYSVYNTELRKITAKLNRNDGKYTTNSEISVTVNYIDEYNRTNTLSEKDYKVTPKLSTKKAGTYTSKITYKSYEASVTYTVSEEFLFDLRIVDDKYIELKESYDDFIDISKIVVTYKDNDTTTYSQDSYSHPIEMVSYDTETCDNSGMCVYTYPVYNTGNFEREIKYLVIPGDYKTPTKIEVYYGKAPTAYDKYHAYKLNYKVENKKVLFTGVTDLNYNYQK